jgi:acyl-coenzyme A synthetase/AMP-(fatty) acid ligase
VAEGHELEIKELPSLPDVYPQFASSQTSIDGAPELFDPLPEVPAFSNDTEMYIHSSGSTGLPKAIPYSHEFVRKMKYQGTCGPLISQFTLFILF